MQNWVADQITANPEVRQKTTTKMCQAYGANADSTPPQNGTNYWSRRKKSKGRPCKKNMGGIRELVKERTQPLSTIVPHTESYY